MEIESVVGRWALVGSTSINGEIAFVGDEPDPNGVSNWLNGHAEDLEESIEQTSGLELEISQDGRFTERQVGRPKVYWFDVEGVLSNEVAPFNGALTFNDKLFYLQPDIPNWSVHAQNRCGEAILRYDDGDTKICDSLRLRGDRLLRTVNVVTDELYTDRVLIAYEKRS
ncbi:MAG: hypothetical protein H7315_14820 [Herminiimonas sp.]|nr:hypothetical protein [Herminiimonas sp.]